MDLGVHDIDVVQYIIGAKPMSVYALGGQGKGKSCNSGACKKRGNINIEICQNEEERDKPYQVLSDNLEQGQKPVIKISFRFCRNG